MIEYTLSLYEHSPISLLDSPIKDMAFNMYTRVLAVASSDSRVVLTNTESESQRSIVDIDVGSINRLAWTSHYDLLAAGSDGCLHHYSMMGMVGESFQVHNSSIAAMKRKGNFIFTGAADGNVCVWDYRRHEMAINIPHKIRNRPQPVKSLAAHGNFIYTSTIYHGKVWMWDLRNTSKRLAEVGTGDCQNNIEFINGNLYAINGAGIVRISASLSEFEFLYTKPWAQACSRGGLIYNERYKRIIWTDKEMVYMSKIENCDDGTKMNSNTMKWDIKNIGGVEKYKDDQVFLFKNNGAMSTLEISYVLDNTYKAKLVDCTRPV